MKSAFHGDGILEEIGRLSSQGASGRLHISTGITEGAIFFNGGEVVDAHVGKLTGFQAINAVASMPDAAYNFDPAILPPAESTITANERILLKEFFGIEAREPKQLPDAELHWPDDHTTPEKVVPLSEVDDSEHILDAQPQTESSLIQEQFTEPIETPENPLLAATDAQHPVEDLPIAYSAEPQIIPQRDDEATFVRPKPSVIEPSYATPYRPIARPAFRPVLFLILLTVLIGVAAGALVYRMRKAESTASVTPPVQTQTPSQDVPPQPLEKPIQDPPREETASVTPNLTGTWKVINTVEQTSYAAYKNMEVGFNVSINQTGKDFLGTGEKISENGRSLDATSRTPIVVRGTIDGDKVNATFSETGAVRKTNGRFAWRIDKANGGLTGTFVSTAARSRGKSAATKEL